MKFLVAFISLTVALSFACSASRSATSAPPPSPSPTSEPGATPAPNSTRQEKLPCMLTMSAAPTIKGLRLGMSPDEVLALFPGSKEDPDVRAQLARPVGPLGNSSFVIRPAKHDSKLSFTDLTQVSVSVLDGQVTNFSIGFNGPEYKHVDEFVTKFIEGTNLPAADQWEAYSGLDTQMKTLSCSGFSIRVFAGGEGGNLNYVLYQDLEADKKLKERRKKAREQASPTPGSSRQ